MLKNYKCPWCKEEFSRDVEFHPGKPTKESIRGKKGSFSNQVMCPQCGNFIPTWKKELTGEIVGRKHIHIRR